MDIVTEINKPDSELHLNSSLYFQFTSLRIFSCAILMADITSTCIYNLLLHTKGNFGISTSELKISEQKKKPVRKEQVS